MIQRAIRQLRSSKAKAHVQTYLAEGLVLLGTIWVYRLAATGGEETLDAYVIARRTVSFVQPVMLMGLVVALTRAVAMASDGNEGRQYLFGALKWSLFPAAILLAAALAMPTTWSRTLFGTVELAALVPPVALLIIGLGGHGLVYSYYRGRHAMTMANALQVLGLALVPNAAFLLFDGLERVLWATSIGVIALPILFTLPLAFTGVRSAGRHHMELLRYGLPRVPGDAAYGALLTIPIYVAGSLHGLSVGGQLGMGITLLNITAAAFAPIALLLLPDSANKLAKGDHQALLGQIDRTVVAVLGLSLLMLLLFEVLAPWLLGVYLGQAGATYVPLARLLFLAAPAFAFFITMRSVLDAYFVAPRNGINILSAFLLLVLLCCVHAWTAAPPIFLAGSVVLSLYYLGWRTFRDLRFVRKELVRLSERTAEQLRLVMVIPGSHEGHGFPFARRQARVFSERFGDGVEVFFLETRMHPLGLLKARWRFKQLLRSYRPDAVMVHYGTVTALFTVLSSSAPVIVTFHGSDLNATPSDGRVRDLLGRFFSQMAAFFAAGIITVSEQLRERLWWRREEAVVLPMGVDLQAFAPLDRSACRSDLGWPAGERVVLFNNNNPALKRLDIAEAVIARVRAAGIPVRLERLEGGIPPDRMPVLMNGADALLLCSDREGSPTMVKEAMACGLPVVTSDVGDVRSRLEGVRPGAVVAQDVDALSEALIAVLRDPQRSNGRELARRNGIDADDLDQRTHDMVRTLLMR